MLLLTQILAQTGTQSQGMDLLNNSLELAQQTAKAWEHTWDTVINPTSQLWQALVDMGRFLAVLSILYLLMTQGKEAIERNSFADLIKMAAVPIVIAMFLGLNGAPLSKVVLAIRGYGHYQVQQVLKLQSTGTISFGQAVGQAAITSAAISQIDALYSQCAKESGVDLAQCWISKQAQAQRVVQAAEQQAGTTLPDLESHANRLAQAANAQGGGQQGGGFTLDVGDALKSAIIFILKGLLWAMQWAFVNLLEVSLLLSALMAPVALGLSVMPLATRPIIAWLVGFATVFGIELSYNVVVGLVATIVIESAATTAADMGFLIFITLLAPILAVTLNVAAGAAVFHAMTSTASSIARYAVASALVGTVGTIGAAETIGAANTPSQVALGSSTPGVANQNEFGV